MPGARPLQAIVCDYDTWSFSALNAMVTAAGFEIVGDTNHSVDAIRLTRLLHPTLVVISQEQNGVTGLEAIPDLREGDDPPEVILISLVDDIRDMAKERGAFEVAVRGEVEMLERLLAEVAELLATGERRKSRDRRSGTDRRKKQDWSKVTYERRSGKDRRGLLRREQDAEVAEPKPLPHRHEDHDDSGGA